MEISNEKISHERPSLAVFTFTSKFFDMLIFLKPIQVRLAVNSESSVFKVSLSPYTYAVHIKDLTVV